MAPKNKKKQAPAIDADWMPEGVEGADTAEDWIPEGVEGAEAVSAPQPLPPSAPPVIGAGETFLNRAVNALPLGHAVTDVLSTGAVQAAKALGLGDPGARLTPQAQAELAAMGEDVATANTNSLPNALETYRQLRDIRNARTELGSEQNPWAARAGTATGVGLSMLAPLPKFAPKGQGLPAQALAAAKTGAAYGALTGLTEGSADLTRGDVGGAARDVLLGGTIGAGLGAALPVALKGGWKARAGTGAALGAGYGAMDEATEADATPASIARNAVAGGVLGAAGGVALPLAVKGAERLWKGVVRPTEAAKYLRSKGVPLTSGQMNPESTLAQIEEASTTVGGIGKSIQGQRDAAREGWQNAVLNEAQPPGMTPVDPKQPIGARLSQAYEGFEPAYAPAKAAKVAPKNSEGLPLATAPAPPKPPKGGPTILDEYGRPIVRPDPPAPPPGAFDKVVADRSILATDETRGVVKNFLDDQLTLLGKQSSGGKVPAGVLMQMRSNIRAAAADAAKAQDFPKAQLLERAEAEVTGALERSLPEEAARGLRAADMQYAKYKTVEDAVARSSDSPNGFTPSQLSNAIKAASEKGAYARGAGGELRKLASAGREVLDARVPMTGARLMVSGPAQYVTAPMSYAANLPPVQRFLLGEYAPQRALTSVEEALAKVLRRNPVEAQTRALLPEDQRKLLEQQAQAEALRRTAESRQ